MMIWIILLAMTAAAVMAVLWPLSRHAAVADQADPNTQFYRDQIAEIERDRERGALLPAEAEAAKAEAGPPASAGERSAGDTARAPWANPPFAAAGRPRPWHSRWCRSWRWRSMARSDRRTSRSSRCGAPARSPRADDIARSHRPDRGAPGQESAGRPRLGGHRSGLSPHGPDRRRREGLRDRPASSRPRRGTASPITARRSSSPRTASSRGGPSGFREGARSSIRPRPRRGFIWPAPPSRTARLDKAREGYAALLTLRPSDAPWVPRGSRSRSRASMDLPERRRGRTDGDAIAGMVESLAARLDSPRRQRRRMDAADPLLHGLGPARQSQATAVKAREALAPDNAAGCSRRRDGANRLTPKLMTIATPPTRG